MKAKARANNRKTVRSLIINGWKNSLKCSQGISEDIHHKIAKFWLSNFCWEHNIEFYTEATFTKGGRADFIVSDWGVVIEVLNTEKKKTFLNKNYPLPTIPIKATTSGAEIQEMMSDLDVIGANGVDYYKNKYMREEND